MTNGCTFLIPLLRCKPPRNHICIHLHSLLMAPSVNVGTYYYVLSSCENILHLPANTIQNHINLIPIQVYERFVKFGTLVHVILQLQILRQMTHAIF